MFIYLCIAWLCKWFRYLEVILVRVLDHLVNKWWIWNWFKVQILGEFYVVINDWSYINLKFLLFWLLVYRILGFGIYGRKGIIVKALWSFNFQVLEDNVEPYHWGKCRFKFISELGISVWWYPFHIRRNKLKFEFNTLPLDGTKFLFGILLQPCFS